MLGYCVNRVLVRDGVDAIACRTIAGSDGVMRSATEFQFHLAVSRSHACSTAIRGSWRQTTPQVVVALSLLPKRQETGQALVFGSVGRGVEEASVDGFI